MKVTVNDHLTMEKFDLVFFGQITESGNEMCCKARLSCPSNNLKTQILPSNTITLIPLLPPSSSPSTTLHRPIPSPADSLGSWGNQSLNPSHKMRSLFSVQPYYVLDLILGKICYEHVWTSLCLNAQIVHFTICIYLFLYYHAFIELYQICFL